MLEENIMIEALVPESDSNNSAAVPILALCCNINIMLTGLTQLITSTGLN